MPLKFDMWKLEDLSLAPIINILVAEEDPAVSHTIEACCRGRKKRITTVSRFSDLLKELERDSLGERSYDVLIVDVVLANGDAHSAIDRWVSRHPGPVIAIVEQEEYTQKALSDLIQRGAWFLIDKPINPVVLFHQMQRFAAVVVTDRLFEIQRRMIIALKRRQIALMILTIISLFLGGAEHVPGIVQALLGLL